MHKKTTLTASKINVTPQEMHQISNCNDFHSFFHHQLEKAKHIRAVVSYQFPHLLKHHIYNNALVYRNISSRLHWITYTSPVLAY